MIPSSDINGATTLNVETFSITTFSIKAYFEALGINDIQHINDTQLSNNFFSHNL